MRYMFLNQNIVNLSLTRLFVVTVQEAKVPFYKVSKESFRNVIYLNRENPYFPDATPYTNKNVDI